MTTVQWDLLIDRPQYYKPTSVCVNNTHCWNSLSVNVQPSMGWPRWRALLWRCSIHCLVTSLALPSSRVAFEPSGFLPFCALSTRWDNFPFWSMLKIELLCSESFLFWAAEEGTSLEHITQMDLIYNVQRRGLRRIHEKINKNKYKTEINIGGGRGGGGNDWSRVSYQWIFNLWSSIWWKSKDTHCITSYSVIAEAAAARLSVEDENGVDGSSKLFSPNCFHSWSLFLKRLRWPNVGKSISPRSPNSKDSNISSESMPWSATQEKEIARVFMVE